jgi:hypothetical protein
VAKRKDDEVAEVLQAAQEPTTTASMVDAQELSKRVAVAQEKLAQARKDQELAQLAAKQRAYQEDIARRKLEVAQRNIPVLVQQRRDRPVRIRELVIPCRTPVLVNRRELRKLEGLRQQGVIQLVVGELEKPKKLEG